MKRSTWAIVAAGVGGIAALLGQAPFERGVVINLSPSVPVGLYLPLPRAPTIGDFVLLSPPTSSRDLLYRRGYLRAGRPLIKILAAGPGMRVCRLGRRVWINGDTKLWARRTDVARRLMPTWSGCRLLKRDEVFVVGVHPLSFDSRYFGAVDHHLIFSTVLPILLFRDR
ncbi:S26 family signal peptidase [Hyphomicrobium sp. CS1BSMeth3]|uniref:S26 family signal peptidase n=1 Tax=Hyphomicrobium sp. CS1BSMeth3 TaxID=1892844 RepID=UPI00157628FA|nr:S26 family signal peptidase [Hyphomicrobium sp. CS1BSMeth3]